jgi:predicted NBD/HSP70 family sugar kinase
MSPESLHELEHGADLGLPLPRTRLRGLKRAVIRVCWVFLHKQVDFNHEVARALDRVASRMGDVAHESAASAKVVDDLRVRVGQLQVDVAARHDEALRVLRAELGELQQEVARASALLSDERVRSGVLEGQAAELSRMLVDVGDRLAGLTATSATPGAITKSVVEQPREAK